MQLPTGCCDRHAWTSLGSRMVVADATTYGLLLVSSMHSSLLTFDSPTGRDDEEHKLGTAFTRYRHLSKSKSQNK